MVLVRTMQKIIDHTNVFKAINGVFKFFIFTTALLSFLKGSAQKKQEILSGIYLTASDYSQNKLDYANPCGEMHKIKLHDFLGKKHITVKHNDSTFVLSKDSIYGFRDCEGREFRFYKSYSEEYKILENKTLCIYAVEVSQPSLNGKGFTIVLEYYFSVKPDGSIYELTTNNIKNVFPGDHSLHDRLDQYFPNDVGINEYDYRHEMYRVNHIIENH